MTDELVRSRERQFAGVLGAAVLVATAGLLFSSEMSERLAAGPLLVGLLVVAMLGALISRIWIAGPTCGVAFAWFAFSPALDLIHPRFDVGPPPASFVAWSWAVAGLIALAFLRRPWAR